MDRLPPSSSGLSAALPQGVRRIFAIAGGRPGVGHSVLSVNLGVYLAQLGRKVVLVDADPSGPALHSMLSLEMPVPEVDADPFEPGELVTVPTLVPGLSLLPQQYSRSSTTPLRPGRKPRWVGGLRHLDADYIIIDLGPGTSAAALDVYLTADFGISVTAPDPPSIEATYRFLKALFQRQVRKLLLKDRYKMRIVERAIAQLPPLPSPLELIRAIAAYDQATAEAAASQLASLRAYLVTNNTRLRSDVELGRSMVDLSERYLGVRLDLLGNIEHDDAIWLSVVRRRPLMLDNSAAKSSRNLERIARRVVAIATSREKSSTPSIDWEEGQGRSLYDVLWTHRGAADEELRRAYKRQKEVFQPGSLALSSLLTEAERERDYARIEEAQDTLLDPVRRRAYDLSFFTDRDIESDAERPLLDEAAQQERAMLQEELAHELGPETEYTGELLRRVRESEGIELEDIAKKTKISATHLLAIEEEDFLKLPAEVYTRGFVSQMAQILGLDATQATRTYIRRFKTFRKKHAPQV